MEITQQKEIQMKTYPTITLSRFLEVYADELNTEQMIKIIPKYEDRGYCMVVANKMLQAVIKNATEEKYRSDWLKSNDAMRRAARFFGIKGSPQFRAIIKELALKELG